MARADARLPANNEEDITLFLKMWWSKLYKRPLKDPILERYTFEELVYEFYANAEYELARAEQSEEENDKINTEVKAQADDWADRMEALEREGTLDKTKAVSPDNAVDNMAWMQKYIENSKAEHGSDFGEDISEVF